METLEVKADLAISDSSSVKPMGAMKAPLGYKGLKEIGDIAYSGGTSIRYWM